MEIFYFWESKPNTELPGYLSLCIKTWENNAKASKITRITHENLEQYSHGKISVEKLKYFSYPLQSDVAAISVLNYNPGLFLDVDTIIFPGFNVSCYSNDKLTMYGDASLQQGGHSTGFFCTEKEQNPFLRDWLEDAKQRIDYQTRGYPRTKWLIRRIISGKSARVGWDYLGNQIIDPLICNKGYRNYIEILDSIERGYVVIPYFADKYDWINQKNVAESYRALWWNNEIDENEVVEASHDRVICLQNSWTPRWYMDKNSDKVLSDNCLISRVISRALEK